MSYKSRSINNKNTDTSDASQNDTITELEQEKERLVTEGKYIEANEIKKKLTALKANKTTKQKKTISNKEKKHSEKLVELYTEEYDALIQSWEEKIKTFVEKYQENEEKLEKEHARQMEEYVENLMNKYPSIKFSRAYLEMKNTELKLAKQERFKEAEFYKKKCEKQEQKELEEYNNKKTISIQKKAEGLSIKQENEKKNLTEKFEIKLELMKKERDADIEKLDMKYKNLKNELDYVYKYENYVSDKNFDINTSLRGNSTIRRMNNMINQNEKLNSIVEHNDCQEDACEDEENEEDIGINK
ncbi:MAG: hypothetical protein MJ252_01315 [archaeon]|nr:hypothetical protein [archaeon]